MKETNSLLKLLQPKNSARKASHPEAGTGAAYSERGGE